MQSEVEAPEEYPLTKVKLDDLVFDKTNPNRPSKEVIEGIRKSILEFGLVKPIVINEKMEIADGEHRALVWKALGKTDIQAYIVPKLNDDIKRRLARQTLNKLQGEHDIKLDADEMALIFQAGQLNNLAELIAQGRESLENILTKHKGIMFQHEDNFDVDKALEDLVPETQLGDIWQLGQHRIICADCTDKRSIDRLLEDKKPEIIFTDPPYGINYEYNEHEDTEGKSYTDFCAQWFPILREHAPLLFITTGWKYRDFWYSNYPPDDEMIWFDKTKQSGGRSFHLRKTEPIMIWGKVKRKFEWDIVESQGDRGDGMRLEHSCPKPIDLPRRFIVPQTDEESIILDPFLGSGSTLIACEQTNRICYGVEIDPHYVDVCCKRYEAYTNTKAILLPREEMIKS